ncbi:hypothetical protein SAMN04489761_2016 [Tenacibaculum sp. MAR_2009_124]|uniref:hypothetical protein n=1 Tax=Tenacibaculum sp. MAR_2009_124 TaxID=1250059 RepID=UPI0008993E19|nr:hypothetical protein [Tenacibaculum sp. MAR_2009_124]SEB87287.1 hypothetical protein SAMN04489761_2016 [Tenacibaculum sp. MAR_2009_124]
MNLKTFTITLSFLLIFVSCKNTSEKEEKVATVQKETMINFKNKGHELVYNLAQKVGDYKKLRAKKDVVYTYTYITPDGKADISTEKYIFNGELSYGNYKQHQRTLPKLKGTLEQGYDGKEYWLKVNGKLVNDTTALNRVKFNRPTNFYWFTMFQKLLDPGLKYDYLGEKELANATFDIVKVSFESKNEKPTDIYQLYINKETGLVDQFLFTVVDFGVIETPLLMQMEYEKIDGFLIPTKRKYKKSTWEAEVTEAPWIMVNWTDIKFDTHLKREVFKK